MSDVDTTEDQPLLRIASARGRRMKGNKCFKCCCSRCCVAIMCFIMIVTALIAAALAVLIAYGVIDKEVDMFIGKVRN